jgi:hypothetical protein
MNFMAPAMPPAEYAFKPYKDLVEQFDQAIPMMLWGTRHAITPVQVIPPENWPEEASLTDLYAYCANQLLAELGQPAWVIVSAEAYTTTVETWGEVEAYRHGDAQRRLEAGDTSVGEAVCITAVSTREDYSYEVPFVRQPHRVRWGTPRRSEASGAIADLLKQLVR